MFFNVIKLFLALLVLFGISLLMIVVVSILFGVTKAWLFSPL